MTSKILFRPLIISSILLLIFSCVPPKPPALVVTRAGSGERAKLLGYGFEVGALQVLELKDYKRIFLKLYTAEIDFKKTYQISLQTKLKADDRTPILKLELVRMVIDEQSEGYAMFTNVLYSTIEIQFRIIDATNNVIVEGKVKARSSNANFPSLHPNESRLANAVEVSQQHLVDFLKGKMPEFQIETPLQPERVRVNK